MNENPNANDKTEDLVRYAATLSAAERREYEALAKLDDEHGEDVLQGEKYQS